MDIVSLTVVLSVIVALAASVLIVSNEPPWWVYALSALGALTLSRALLDGPDLTSAVRANSLAAWAVRLALTSTITAVSSFFVGRGSGSRVDTEDDVRETPQHCD
ncbi:hypothetical protein JHN63_12335 [Streptomyces sp. MBT65]|uniref:hypothetical protein n=1 Tax=Streptomyces sp. MBT65 TaxID=1488395 RepID=UPI001909897E|nr:hypothetical protein [Streptomyces sp. MBT65]MBK3574589.1 hypothetical protein [Streptomyces sp. MBT65]